MELCRLTVQRSRAVLQRCHSEWRPVQNQQVFNTNTSHKVFMFLYQFNSETWPEEDFNIDIYRYIVYERSSFQDSSSSTSIMNSCLSLAEMKAEIKKVLRTRYNHLHADPTAFGPTHSPLISVCTFSHVCSEISFIFKVLSRLTFSRLALMNAPLILNL